MVCLETPTACTTPWDRPDETSSALFPPAGPARLGASPLRHYHAEDPDSVAPFLTEEVIRFLGLLYPRLADAFPLRGLKLRVEEERDLFIVALVAQGMEPEALVDAHDRVLDWFVRNETDGRLVLSSRYA